MAWPFDFKEEIIKFKKTHIEKMDSERALLNFFLTKLYRIDPDIIVGHDISGYGVSLLLDRMALHKVPNWSRIGRLRRSAIPNHKVLIWFHNNIVIHAVFNQLSSCIVFEFLE